VLVVQGQRPHAFLSSYIVHGDLQGKAAMVHVDAALYINSPQCRGANGTNAMA